MNFTAISAPGFFVASGLDHGGEGLDIGKPASIEAFAESLVDHGDALATGAEDRLGLMRRRVVVFGEALVPLASR